VTAEAPKFQLFVSQPSTGLSSGDDQEVTPVILFDDLLGPVLSFTWQETYGRGKQEKDLRLYRRGIVEMITFLADALAEAEARARSKARES
jgi:hypothetical protein